MFDFVNIHPEEGRTFEGDCVWKVLVAIDCHIVGHPSKYIGRHKYWKKILARET